MPPPAPRVVLDTNVLVSAFLKAESNPALILSLFLEGYLTVCLSKEILDEYREVLKREKFRHLDQESLDKFLAVIGQEALLVTPSVTVTVAASDSADNKFLECAVEARADFLITGNTRHFPVKKFKNIRIITPRNFLDLLGEAISRR